jgi:hypothetical protein
MIHKVKQYAWMAVLALSTTSLKAADNNYFKHRAFFDLCSYKLTCSYCASCTRQLYTVKIENKLDKKIKHIYYQYYSELNNKVITKEAVIQGGQIDNKQKGTFEICVHNKIHWTISELVYDDNTSERFMVEGPLKSFIQEPDECDCALDRRGKAY